MGCRGLLERHGAFYARLTIPADVRDALDGKRELRERLGTDRRQAERDLHAVMAKFHSRVAAARKGLALGKPAVVRPMSIAEAAQAHHATELAYDDAERLASANGHQIEFPTGWSTPYRDLLRKVAARRGSDEEIGAAIGWALDGLVARNAIAAKPGTDEWRRLAHTLAAVQLDAMDREAERDAGDFEGVPRLAILGSSNQAPAPKVVTPPPRALRPESYLPLREFVYLMHAEKTGVRASTRAEQVIAVRFLEEFMGGPTPAHAVTRRDMLAYKEALRQTPVKYASRFPGRTLPEAIKGNLERKIPYPVLSSTTINGKWLSHIQTLYAWAVRNDFVPDNPAQGVRVDLGKADPEPTRIPFTGEEMCALLEAPEIAQPTTERAWGVLVAAYTGMRVGEVAQLRLEGITQVDGVPVFSVEGELKNAGSRRLVPMHSRLIAHGLVARVDALRASGETHLFPDWLARGRRRLRTAARSGKTIQPPWADIHARWFVTKLMADAGIEDRRKRFHSLRHTAKTAMARAGVPREISDFITGHVDHTAGGLYVHAGPLKAMAQAVEAIRFF